jgi:hypothetical protein
MSITVLKHALEVIYEYVEEHGQTKKAKQTMPEIRQAIAEAEKHEVSQEPVAMQMDVIVVNLIREGINKHRARELAEHFIKHTHPQPKQEQGEPVAVMQLHTDGWDLIEGIDTDWLETLPFGTKLYTHPPQRRNEVTYSEDTQPKRERVVFPTMLRQMWSGGEVQEWLDENVNKEPL